MVIGLPALLLEPDRFDVPADLVDVPVVIALAVIPAEAVRLEMDWLEDEICAAGKPKGVRDVCAVFRTANGVVPAVGEFRVALIPVPDCDLPTPSLSYNTPPSALPAAFMPHKYPFRIAAGIPLSSRASS